MHPRWLNIPGMLTLLACVAAWEGAIQSGLVTFDYLPAPSGVLVAFLELVRSLGLEERLVAAQPSARSRAIALRGQLERLPAGPVSFVRSPILSARGKLRLLAEPIIARGWLYASTADGYVVALQVGDRTLDGWHMFGGDPRHNGPVEGGGESG